MQNHKRLGSQQILAPAPTWGSNAETRSGFMEEIEFSVIVLYWFGLVALSPTKRQRGRESTVGDEREEMRRKFRRKEFFFKKVIFLFYYLNEDKIRRNMNYYY